MATRKGHRQVDAYESGGRPPHSKRFAEEWVNMKRILYLGTDPSAFIASHPEAHVFHYPVIQVVPRSASHPDLRAAYAELASYTHIVFTSKHAVRILLDHLQELSISKAALQAKQLIAIGSVTARQLAVHDLTPAWIAEEETQEGLITQFREHKESWESSYYFLPRSSRSRPELLHYFKEQGVKHKVCDLYDTLAQKKEPVPDLNQFDEIVFTSPSTVDAFLTIYLHLPEQQRIRTTGPITKAHLAKQVQT